MSPSKSTDTWVPPYLTQNFFPVNPKLHEHRASEQQNERESTKNQTPPRTLSEPPKKGNTRKRKNTNEQKGRGIFTRLSIAARDAPAKSAAAIPLQSLVKSSRNNKENRSLITKESFLPGISSNPKGRKGSRREERRGRRGRGEAKNESGRDEKGREDGATSDGDIYFFSLRLIKFTS